MGDPALWELERLPIRQTPPDGLFPQPVAEPRRYLPIQLGFSWKDK